MWFQGIHEAICSSTCQTMTRLPSNVGCPPQIRRSATMYFPNCTRPITRVGVFSLASDFSCCLSALVQCFPLSAFAFISRQDYALGPNKSQGCHQAISPSHLRFPMPNISLAKAEPSRRGNLLLREELHAFLALHVQVPKKRFVPSIERKPRHRSRHADVDPNHPALNSMFEFARGLSRAGENGSAVAVRRAVGCFDRRIKILEMHYMQHRPENLLFRDRHS